MLAYEILKLLIVTDHTGRPVFGFSFDWHIDVMQSSHWTLYLVARANYPET